MLKQSRKTKWLLALSWLACLGIMTAGSAKAAPKYPQYAGRATQTLDGSWHFAWLGNADLARLDPGTVDCTDLAAVPGVFDTALDHFGRRGTGVYRRTVIAAAGLQRLKVGGLGLYAKVWWDQLLIGEIKLPYTSVDLDFTNPSDGEHTLTLAVDNRFSELTAPLFKPNYDFYAYGGIYRSLVLQTLPSKRIEHVQITTQDPQTGRIRIRLTLAGIADGETAMALAFDKGASATRNITVAQHTAELVLTVPNAKPWTPATPNLHILSVKLGNDSVTERFGLRTLTAAGRQILLNGQPLRLLGVNRHESHPEFGPVQNTHLMLEDIHLVRALGGNFIRCVHYQHDPEFYELCDETGMLVWAESLGWGLSEKALLPLESLLVDETHLLGEMVANHPAVIIAGFLNESASDKQSSLPLYRKLAAALRAAAPGTLVSYASNRLTKDLCFEVCDVVSVNYYPGWIAPLSWTNSSSEQIKPYVDELAAWFNQPDNKAVYDKPLLTTEIGCCGVYGVRDRALAQWSEDYQADYMTTAIRAILGHPRFCGITLWQMFDTRSFVNTGEVRGKFRGFNSAGLLDEYRRPKLAYDEVQKLFRELK